METFRVNRRYCNRIDAVRVSVEVALITVCCPISTRKYKDGTLPISPIIDTIHNSLLDKVPWTFHRLTIVWRTPAAAVDGHVLEAVIKSSRFIDV